MSDDGPPIRFEVMDIDRVNPQPWQLGEGYRYTVRGAMELDEANGEKNKNNRTLRNKYDGGAVEGVDDLDQTYNFKIGYA